jgi:hypothetical protein
MLCQVLQLYGIKLYTGKEIESCDSEEMQKDSDNRKWENN